MTNKPVQTADAFFMGMSGIKTVVPWVIILKEAPTAVSECDSRKAAFGTLHALEWSSDPGLFRPRSLRQDPFRPC
jgi:hypothetical protein